MKLESENMRRDYLPLKIIKVRPQMRKTIDRRHIEDLKVSILAKGLVNDLLVAHLNGEYWLIAGHCRKIAIEELIQEGKLPEKIEVPVKIYFNLSEEEFIFLQATENVHKEVPPHEAAEAYRNSFEMIKLKYPRYPLSKFAKNVGRSVPTVKKAIAFCLLPKEVQQMVRSKSLSYGAATELTKLMPHLSVLELTLWAINIVVARDNIESIRVKVENFIRDRKTGQLSLFDLVARRNQKEFKRQTRKSLFDRQLTLTFWGILEYWRSILNLIKKRRVTKKDFPSSVKTMRRNFKEMAGALKNIMPHLKDFFPRTSFEKEEELLLVLEKYIDLLKED